MYEKLLAEGISEAAAEYWGYIAEQLVERYGISEDQAADRVLKDMIGVRGNAPGKKTNSSCNNDGDIKK